VSDARPITNITDFVCSTCWSGFSRTDPGVERGDELICPHCGTPLPGDEDQLANAVRNAPRVADRDSGEFVTKQFRDTSEIQPEKVTQSGGWLPPEHHSAPPATRAATESDEYDSGFGSGVVVGDPDQDFAVAERTLSGTQDDDALLAAVRQTSPIPKSFIVGDELSITTDEPTPVDITALTDMDEAIALAQQLEAPLPETDLAHRDWKLKAMGITYNFHGLDPLFSWAANKSGQPMALSHDGETWKDFHTFYAAIRDGVAVKKAFENAPDPSNAPPPPVTPRVTRTINQIRPELPELEGLRPPSDGNAPVNPRNQTNPAVPVLPANRTSQSPSIGVAGRSGNTANLPTIGGSSQPSGTMRAAVVGSGTRSGASLSPSTSPSKRMPVANVQPKSKLSPALIALIAIVVVLGVVAGLHFGKIVRIPGLP
jgi:hypothetical protein